MRSLIISILIMIFASQLQAATCEQAAAELNRALRVRVDEKELAEAIRHLNSTHNVSLPPKFITKREAHFLGWRPGKNLWSIPELKGKSIGGDRFGNREGRLPEASGRRWKEADLDYKGGKRGAKRLLFSTDGIRMVTVDHYSTFSEVPACR